jgi:spore germination protein YaaH
MSEKATALFKKAHQNGTRIVLTITQMDNASIRQIMDDPAAQESLIAQSVEMVKERGIDGINIDFEYSGDPGEEYRQKFSAFSKNLTDRIHGEIPSSRVTASVYASAVKDPKIYDIKTLSEATDGIFMMAYDFAVAGSANAIPTAPLYGHKEGKYWYDISTAVDEFLTQMDSKKLILGVPWYGYNYAVEAPTVKTATTKGYYTSYKKGKRTYRSYVPLKSYAQTYTLVQNEIGTDSENYKEGFDEYGKVSWKAYYEGGTWRMVFIDDVRSQAYKYDFAKEKNLAGVGMWALGFDNGKGEFWDLLKDKFGIKDVADASITNREIK